MGVSCEYPDCRETATMVLVIEVGGRSVEVALCDAHAWRAQEIARRHGGIAYRLYPI
jgi:hypothetical protein